MKRVLARAGLMSQPGWKRASRLSRSCKAQSCYKSGGLKTIMKKMLFILFVMMFAVGIAGAQQLANQDILGPHNVNGHGCASCHAPHSGAAGNRGTNAASGENYLWGRDFYATQYFIFGYDGNTAGPYQFSVSNAGAFSQTDPLFHTAACLSCHDGNQTKVVGMTGLSVEKVEGGSVATYLNDGSESLKNDHPVHRIYDPTDSHNWAGTVSATGSITWTASAALTDFNSSYYKGSGGSPTPTRFYAGTGLEGTGSYVECSTCHNPHSVNYVNGNYGGGTGVVKATNFFVRGWYNTDNPASTSGQQFCRSCHYSKSNQSMGVMGIATQ